MERFRKFNRREPPAYGIIYINKHSSIVHFHDFLDNTAFISNADPTFQP